MTSNTPHPGDRPEDQPHDQPDQLDQVAGQPDEQTDTGQAPYDGTDQETAPFAARPLSDYQYGAQPEFSGSPDDETTAGPSDQEEPTAVLPQDDVPPQTAAFDTHTIAPDSYGTAAFVTDPVAPPAEQRSGRQSGFHPVNIGHLVMGVAFLGLFAVWTLYIGEVVDLSNLRWLLPVPWVAAGALGLLALALRSGRRDEPAY